MFGVHITRNGKKLFLELPISECELDLQLDRLSSGLLSRDVPLLGGNGCTVKLYATDETSAALLTKVSEGDTLWHLAEVAFQFEGLCADRGLRKNDTLSHFRSLRQICRMLYEEPNPLIIRTNLLRKETRFDPKICAVEKSIEVDFETFHELRTNLLHEHPLIAENRDLMYEANGRCHCILIYNSECGDGLLIESEGYDYARYAQYIPGAALLVAQHEQSLHEPEQSEGMMLS